MKKSISRTLAQIDVAANISVRIHEDFFNTHPCSRHLSSQLLSSSQRVALTKLDEDSFRCAVKYIATAQTAKKLKEWDLKP